jgi:transcriptional regulator with XRE-family HTH domain
MRKSSGRHPLGILRLMLGLTQKEMADLAGCAAITIQSIERGKLALSGKLAEHISAITGVNEEWLVAGDPTAEMIAEDGSAYTPREFEERRAILFNRKLSPKRAAFEHEFTPEVLAAMLIKIYSITRKGQEQSRFAWTIYRIQVALQALERELGSDRESEEKLLNECREGNGFGKLRAAVQGIEEAHAKSKGP